MNFEISQTESNNPNPVPNSLAQEFFAGRVERVNHITPSLRITTYIGPTPRVCNTPVACLKSQGYDTCKLPYHVRLGPGYRSNI